MQTLILSLHVIVCVTLVILVLLQAGKEGMGVIFGGGTLFETALTQFVINLRYALMSLSLSQKLERRVGLIDRMLFTYPNIMKLTNSYICGNFFRMLADIGYT